MHGKLISLDGVDGSGKSTQVKLLAEWFEAHGRETLALRDPGGTRLGEALREILLHRQEIPLDMVAEMLLYMSSRAQLVAEIIRPALLAGKIVICDRFLLANVVYQGCAGGLSVDAIWQVGEIATGGLKPDLTIIMDVDLATAAERLGPSLDRLESRGEVYRQRVRQGFMEQASQLGEQAIVLDASGGVDAIHEHIVAVVASRFGLIA